MDRTPLAGVHHWPTQILSKDAIMVDTSQDNHLSPGQFQQSGSVSYYSPWEPWRSDHEPPRGQPVGLQAPVNIT